MSYFTNKLYSIWWRGLIYNIYLKIIWELCVPFYEFFWFEEITDKQTDLIFLSQNCSICPDLYKIFDCNDHSNKNFINIKINLNKT